VKELVNTHVPLSGVRHACIWFLEILDGCEGARGTLAFGHLGTHTEYTPHTTECVRAARPFAPITKFSKKFSGFNKRACLCLIYGMGVWT